MLTEVTEVINKISRHNYILYIRLQVSNSGDRDDDDDDDNNDEMTL